METIIKWQTGTPKEMCTCLVTIVGGTIEVADWNGSEWDTWDCWLEDSIIAWCKLSDIKPYKGE